MTRSILRRDLVDRYGGMISMGSADSYSLIQDVHVVGGGRYMVQTGLGTSGVGGKGIVRRTVARLDFAGTNQPIASFAHYGNNSGNGSQGTLFQNSIAIDGPYIDTGLGAYSYKWGSIYNPKNALDLRYQGAMSINDGGRYAFWVNDNIGSPQSDLEHVLVLSGSGTSGSVRASAGQSLVDHATIADAWIQFQVDDDDPASQSTSLTIDGQASDNAAAFSTSSGSISSRPRTSAAVAVAWSPPAWNQTGAVGPDQQTPGLAGIIQEIVDRPGWTSGNALVIIVTGSGKRVAESYDGDPGGGPLLHVDFDAGPPPPASLFADDFESGDTTLWTSSAGGPPPP